MIFTTLNQRYTLSCNMPPSVKPENDATVTDGEIYYPSQSIVELADANDLAAKDELMGLPIRNLRLEFNMCLRMQLATSTTC